MAISPKEILETLTREDQQAIQRMERYFDSELKTRFTGKPVDVFYYEDVNDRVKNAIREMYTANGWQSVTFSGVYHQAEFTGTATFKPKGWTN